MAEHRSTSKPANRRQAVAPPKDPRALVIKSEEGDTHAQTKAKAATKASINAGLVIGAYQSNIMGKDADITELVTDMGVKFKAVNAGDLSNMENMLVGQATALQTMFTHLSQKAVAQEQLNHYQTFMVLALKAQSQSRATILALVDLKYPRQAATFVKQANIAAGHQQVNNGNASASKHTGINMQPESHAKNLRSEQSKLLEEADHERLDIGATQATSRVNQAVQAVG